MPNYCTQCGTQIFYESDVCGECLSQPHRQQQQKPFAEQTRTPFETQPLNYPHSTHPIQPFQGAHQQPQNLQNFAAACPYCGGAGGIMTRSTISAGGWIYMGIMFTISFIALVIFFPCAIIPFALLFLGLLFKETHFACVNCGQKVN